MPSVSCCCFECRFSAVGILAGGPAIFRDAWIFALRFCEATCTATEQAFLTAVGTHVSSQTFRRACSYREEETYFPYSNALKVSRLGVHIVCIPCELTGVIKKPVLIRLNDCY